MNKHLIKLTSHQLPEKTKISYPPLFFSLYTSNIPTNHPFTHIPILTDDTAIIFNSKKPNQSTICLQKALDTLINYLNSIKLLINPDKSQPIHFSTQKKQKENTPNPAHPIVANQNRISWRKTAKYLGIIFNSKMKWKDHIETLIKKINQRFRILYPPLNHNSKLSKNMS